jgi:small nuclear ribonucleoprotein (snRNP)-like protein
MLLICSNYIIYPSQLFFSFFKTLVGKEVAVELKNDVSITGILVSVDQFLNIKLSDVQVVDKARYPQLVSPQALKSSEDSQ